MSDAVSRDAVLDILSDEGWLGDSLRRIAALPAVQPDPLCECGMTGPCKWTECKAPILSAHVNETQKREHDAANVLTPATKGGDS
jgi:hypothetical protein